MKKEKDIQDQLQCAETNSLLSQYGFVEEYEVYKKEELRFLYLQLKPTIGLLVYNFYHANTSGNLQGFDMFIYNSNNAKDAINQFHCNSNRTKLGFFSFQSKLENFKLFLDKLCDIDSEDYWFIESKYEQLVKVYTTIKQ